MASHNQQPANQRPALTRLLWAVDLINMPPSLAGETGFGCDGCPFASLSAGQTEAEVANDRAEAFFDCALLGRERVWGEVPACYIRDWQARARDELASRGISGRAGGMPLREIVRREQSGKNVRLHLSCGHSKVVSHRAPPMERAYCGGCPPLTSGQAPG